jgi:hypothetical protein
MGLHALTDALNPWGVAPWWPLSRAGATWNLVHEGDLWFLAAAAACAVVAAFARPRTIALFAAVFFGTLLPWKAHRRAEAERIAHRELPGDRLAVYPSPARDCPWTALASTGDELSAACVNPGRDEVRFRLVRRLRSAQSPLVEDSKSNSSVADFLANRAFPFAELEPAPGGGAVVLWRDLRESLLEGEHDRRFGLAVTFDARGEIVSIEHRWMLKLAF